MGIQKRVVKGKTKYIVRYKDTNGDRRSKSFDKMRQARSWEAERLRLDEAGAWSDSADTKVTVRAACEARMKAADRENTKAVRAQLIANLGPLANKKVKDVRRIQVQDWVNILRDGRPWMDGDALGARTIRGMFAQLKAVFSEFVDDGSLLRNPCSGVTVPKASVAVMDEDIPTAQEVESMADAAGRLYGPSLRLMFLTMAQSGLRPSEACGLQVRDIDVSGLTIRVRRQMGRRRGNDSADTKSNTSVRHVPVAQALIDDLRPLLTNRLGGESLFVRDGQRARLKGEPWIGTAVSNVFKYIRSESGVSDRYSAHTFRHFYASSLIHHGVNVAAVSRALGHADAATTLRVYVHIMPGADDMIREACASIMGDRGGI